MDIHQRAGHGGVVIDQLGELLQLDGGGAELLVLDDVLDLGKKAGVIVAGEEGGVDAEDLGDAKEHRDGERPDVVFDLVDVAGGETQRRSEGSLTEIALTAKLAKAGSHIRLTHAGKVTGWPAGVNPNCKDLAKNVHPPVGYMWVSCESLTHKGVRRSL